MCKLSEVQNEDALNSKEKKIAKMFSEISGTYDRANSILSFGMDKWWRKKFVELAVGNYSDLKVLDLCSGPGNISQVIRKKGAKVYSQDISFQMIELGIKGNRISDGIQGDGLNIPFKNNSFDAVFVAFGVRNIPDLNLLFKEISRVLKPGGQLAIMELTRPLSIYVKAFYFIYLKVILPFLGYFISGSKSAYKYLSDTISSFKTPEELGKIIENSGFCSCEIYRKTFGVISMLVSRKS